MHALWKCALPKSEVIELIVGAAHWYDRGLDTEDELSLILDVVFFRKSTRFLDYADSVIKAYLSCMLKMKCGAF